MTRLGRIAFIVVASILLSGWTDALSQNRSALKTNIIDDATLSPSLGVEFTLSPKWTLELGGSLSAWDTWGGGSLRHAILQPEVRYWVCDRFSRHFFALHAIGGICDVGGVNFPSVNLTDGMNSSSMKDYRYKGWAAGAGLGWGYDFVLGTHWNLETEIAIGYAFLNYDRRTLDGDVLEKEVKRHYVGPTKIALNLVYVF